MFLCSICSVMAPDLDYNRRSRNWVFTLNNPGERGYTHDKLLAWPNMKFVCFQLEKGKGGVLHYQGMLIARSEIRLSTLKKLNKHAHFEKMRGTPMQALTYCTKEDTRQDGPWEVGERPKKQGTRTDLAEYTKALCSKPMDYILKEHAVQLLKYPAGTKMILEENLRAKQVPYRHLTVKVIWGDTRIGKTRSVYAESPDVYKVDNYPWFDGYIGQKAILFDDFYGQIKVSEMLKLLDGYKLTLGVKGAHTFAMWDTVYITSNVHPSDWYHDIPTKVRDALNARFTSILHMQL